MGRYLNPKGMSKEAWLEKNCVELDEIPKEHKVEETTVAVLVDNGDFTAAALAYSQEELDSFLHWADLRPKRFFLVPCELTVNFG